MRILRKTPLVLALVLALFAGACDDEEIIEPIDGTVTGTVSADGEPLLGVVLQLDGPVTRTNTTGSDGTYAFTDVPVGSYVVSIAEAPQDVAFPDDEKAVTVSDSSPDATANFNGSFVQATAGATR